MVKIGGFTYLSNFRTKYGYLFNNFNTNQLDYMVH